MNTNQPEEDPRRETKLGLYALTPAEIQCSAEPADRSTDCSSEIQPAQDRDPTQSQPCRDLAKVGKPALLVQRRGRGMVRGSREKRAGGARQERTFVLGNTQMLTMSKPTQQETDWERPAARLERPTSAHLHPNGSCSLGQRRLSSLWLVNSDQLGVREAMITQNIFENILFL